MNLLIPTLPCHIVIAACDQIGFADPLDHPWVELPEHREPESAHSCDCYKRYGRGEAGKCYLTIEVPIRAFRFITDDGESRYQLGQCLRCRAVYWSEIR